MGVIYRFFAVVVALGLVLFLGVTDPILVLIMLYTLTYMMGDGEE